MSFPKSCSFSSVAMDNLYGEAGEAGEEDIPVANFYFYFDFAAQLEQSATSILSVLPKLVVSGSRQNPEKK